MNEFYYEPDADESLSVAVVTAVAKARNEDVLDQQWHISEDINTDTFDGMFNERDFRMTLQFETDGTTTTTIANSKRDPMVKIESHR